jgi:aconitate hydratase
MALLQFISAGLPKVQIPTTVHSDHLVVSRDGAEEDLKRGRIEHQEVYAFLSSAAKKYGIGWWKPGGTISPGGSTFPRLTTYSWNYSHNYL